MEEATRLLSENLKRILKAKGWNQAFFAEKLGITTATASRLINGNVWVSSEMFKRIAEVCEVSYQSLLSESGLISNAIPEKSKQKNITITEALKVINAYEGRLVIKKKLTKN